MKNYYYIRNTKTDENFDTREMKFYDSNWDPTYEEDKEWLQSMIDADPEKFKNCVVEIVDINYQVTESFDGDSFRDLGFFVTETEARNYFAEQLSKDGYRPAGIENWKLELNKLMVDEDGDLLVIETIDSQILYDEGGIDRMNYKGESAIYYGFECVWNAEKQELEYTFYWEGEKEEGTVLQSELQNWYF